MEGLHAFSGVLWDLVTDKKSVDEPNKEPTREEKVAAVVAEVVASCVDASDENLRQILDKGLVRIRQKLAMEYVFNGSDKEGISLAARKVLKLASSDAYSITPERLSLIKKEMAKHMQVE